MSSFVQGLTAVQDAALKELCREEIARGVVRVANRCAVFEMEDPRAYLENKLMTQPHRLKRPIQGILRKLGKQAGNQ